jgi:lysophospholipase
MTALLLLTLAAAPTGLDPAVATPPPGWQWGQFTNAQGAKLRYGHAVPRDAQLHLAVFGGYTEFAEKYFETLREWHAAGYGVWFLDWRGQGGSDRYHRDRQRAILVDLDHDARDVRDFLQKIVAQPRVCVVGHSLGAHILVRYLHRYPDQSRCAVLSSPTLALGNVTWMPQWLIDAKLGWARWRGQSQDWATDTQEWADTPDRQALSLKMTADPRRRAVHRAWYLAEPSLRLGGVTYQWVETFLRSSAEVLTPDYLKKIRAPILIGTAADDVLASVDAQREAARHLPKATRVEFAPAFHELFMEEDRVRAPWMAAVRLFLARHLY